MLYLLLFTVLSIGFYAASTLSVQIAGNDRSAADAQAAAESGLQFVRYQLGQISVPGDTADADLLAKIAEQLGHSPNSSSNMHGHSIAMTDRVIDIPSADEFLTLDPGTGARFQAQISTRGRSVWVRVIGRGHNEAIVRTIQLEFRRMAKSGETDRLAPVPGSYEEVAP